MSRKNPINIFIGVKVPFTLFMLEVSDAGFP